jgi:serine/threonine-protein kinase
MQVRGFQVQTQTVHRLGPKNVVLEQDPPAGRADQSCDFLKLSCTKPGVTLTVNAGPGQAKVPSVTGLDLAAAEAKLRKAHFVPVVQRVASQTVPDGSVISSDPSGGGEARQGSQVTLNVSSGPKSVAVPLVVGESEAVATAEIRSRGLTAKVVQRTSSTPKGQVIAQAPDGGTRVDQGSQVTLEVSTGTAKVTVPNVIGQTRSGAASLLHARGFGVSVREQPVDVAAQNGRVIDQFPSPNSSQAKGSPVTIFVGKFTAPTPPPTTTTPTTTTPTPRRP